ncbi:MAG: pilus assembly FimT family protein [Gemmatimonadota bacterium]
MTRSTDTTFPRAGFTMVELLIAIAILGIVLGIGFMGMRGFNESTVVDRAATAIASDVTLTRSYAIQRRSTVAIVADEANRSYEIRDESTGDVLQTRSFAADTDLPLTRLDIQTSGDELKFNARGLMVGSGNATILLERLDTGKQIEVSALGRTRVTAAP